MVREGMLTFFTNLSCCLQNFRKRLKLYWHTILRLFIRDTEGNNWTGLASCMSNYKELETSSVFFLHHSSIHKPTWKLSRPLLTNALLINIHTGAMIYTGKGEVKILHRNFRRDKDKSYGSVMGVQMAIKLSWEKDLFTSHY